MTTLYPITLERRLDSRIWGGNTLGAWLGLPDAPPNLAESWQVYEHNRVVNGPDAGRTLADVVTEHGAAIVGTRSFERYGADFPLLAKFIDAADHLSLQVHPNDEYAHSVEAATGFHGKTEAWYILRAAEDTDLIHGLARPSSAAEIADALENGTILELMRRISARPGDTIFVPAGTIHAINAGIMLFEIQQKSDLTYRVYDYNRRDAQGNLRELHVERALDVTTYGEQPPARVEPQRIDATRTLLVSCLYFAMERWDVVDSMKALTDPATFDIFTVLDGSIELSWSNGTQELRRGESVVLPAKLGNYRLEPKPHATLLRCYVP